MQQEMRLYPNQRHVDAAAEIAQATAARIWFEYAHQIGVDPADENLRAFFLRGFLSGAAITLASFDAYRQHVTECG